MPRKITLIRHAAPHVQPGVDPARWSLSDAGRRAAVDLGRRLPAKGVLACSTEEKAVETLCLAVDKGRDEVRLDHRFGEVIRPGEPFDDDHKSRRLAWVTGRLDDRHRTWEAPEQAARRFQEGIDDLHGDVIVATHGMVLTAWIVSIGVITPGIEAGEFWLNLAFPDLVAAEIGTGDSPRGDVG